MPNKCKRCGSTDNVSNITDPSGKKIIYKDLCYECRIKVLSERRRAWVV